MKISYLNQHEDELKYICIGKNEIHNKHAITNYDNEFTAFLYYTPSFNHSALHCIMEHIKRNSHYLPKDLIQFINYYNHSYLIDKHYTLLLTKIVLHENANIAVQSNALPFEALADLFDKYFSLKSREYDFQMIHILEMIIFRSNEKQWIPLVDTLINYRDDHLQFPDDMKIEYETQNKLYSLISIRNSLHCSHLIDYSLSNTLDFKGERYQIDFVTDILKKVNFDQIYSLISKYCNSGYVIKFIKHYRQERMWYLIRQFLDLVDKNVIPLIKMDLEWMIRRDLELNAVTTDCIFIANVLCNNNVDSCINIIRDITILLNNCRMRFKITEKCCCLINSLSTELISSIWVDMFEKDCNVLSKVLELIYEGKIKRELIDSIVHILETKNDQKLKRMFDDSWMEFNED